MYVCICICTYMYIYRSTSRTFLDGPTAAAARVEVAPAVMPRGQMCSTEVQRRLTQIRKCTIHISNILDSSHLPRWANNRCSSRGGNARCNAERTNVLNGSAAALGEDQKVYTYTLLYI